VSLKSIVFKIDFWLPEIRPVFAWYDFWIGLYWDRKKRRLFLFGIPCLGFVFDWSNTLPCVPVVDKPWEAQMKQECDSRATKARIEHGIRKELGP
jgi:hypothetical protein